MQSWQMLCTENVLASVSGNLVRSGWVQIRANQRWNFFSIQGMPSGKAASFIRGQVEQDRKLCNLWIVPHLMASPLEG